MIDEALIETVLEQVSFNDAGLVPAVAQSRATGDVLMLAWMDRRAIRETLSKGMVCYWSRSRGTLWRKGETSGHVQRLVEMRVDCDGDTLLLLVEQTGPACHTNRPSCFYRAVRDGGLVTISQPVSEPEHEPPA